MTQTSIFMNNKTQAVRLPKSVALPEDVKKVEIIAKGRTRLIVPIDDVWDSWFNDKSVSADFMETRDQPKDQERDSF